MSLTEAGRKSWRCVPHTEQDKRLKAQGRAYVATVGYGGVDGFTYKSGYACIQPDGTIGRTRTGRGCQVRIRERDREETMRLVATAVMQPPANDDGTEVAGINVVVLHAVKPDVDPVNGVTHVTLPDLWKTAQEIRDKNLPTYRILSVTVRIEGDAVLNDMPSIDPYYRAWPVVRPD